MVPIRSSRVRPGEPAWGTASAGAGSGGAVSGAVAAMTVASGVAGATTAVAYSSFRPRRPFPTPGAAAPGPPLSAWTASSSHAGRAETPARIANAAGARSHRPRHGERSTLTPLSGPRRASTAAHSSPAPAVVHARSVQTWSTVAGRGRTENMA